MRVEGVDALRRQLAAIPAKVRAGARRGIAESAAAVEADQRAAMAVDTGAARAGVGTRPSSDGLDVEVGVFDPALDYVLYLEYGTSVMPAQPWATPAAEAERPKLTGRVRDAIKGRLT